MPKTIIVDVFNIPSIKSAIKELKAYEIDAKGMEVVKRMAELCAETAKSHYAGSGDGNDDWRVDIIEERNGYTVSASGEDIYFIEFGAGVAAGEGYDTSVITPPVPISPGSWSETRGTKEFATYGSWHHKKVKYTEIVPRKGMYYGVKEATDKVFDIAEEVFNRD